MNESSLYQVNSSTVLEDYSNQSITEHKFSSHLRKEFKLAYTLTLTDHPEATNCTQDVTVK